MTVHYPLFTEGERIIKGCRENYEQNQKCKQGLLHPNHTLHLLPDAVCPFERSAKFKSFTDTWAGFALLPERPRQHHRARMRVLKATPP